MLKTLHQDLTVYHQGHVIKRLKVTSPFTYSFTVAPGTYTLISDQGDRKTVTVMAGHTARADFPNFCA